MITRSVSSVYVTLQPPRETREAAETKRAEERQAEAESFPIGAPVWVMFTPNKVPGTVVGTYTGSQNAQHLVIQYDDGTIRRHPKDKVRPRAVKKAKA